MCVSGSVHNYVHSMGIRKRGVGLFWPARSRQQSARTYAYTRTCARTCTHIYVYGADASFRAVDVVSGATGDQLPNYQQSAQMFSKQFQKRAAFIRATDARSQAYDGIVLVKTKGAYRYSLLH